MVDEQETKAEESKELDSAKDTAISEGPKPEEPKPAKDLKKVAEDFEKMDVSDLKNKLDELNKSKEEWFNKKEELKQKIAEMINEAKSLRSNKDDFTKKVEELKKGRDQFNAEVQDLVKKIKDLNKQNQDRFVKLGERASPDMIKRQIDKLESDLETQAVSFDKEKKIMKQINSLKKKLSSSEEASTMLNESDDVSKKINEAKAKADEFHQKLKDYVKDHKTDFKKFTKLSREINKMKKVQEDAFAKFIDFKQEFVEANRILKDKLGDVKEKKKEQKKKKDEKIKARHDMEEEMINEKAKEVDEKLKKKKILTTEDLIAFQARSDDEE
ncbi:MAG: hypothetical protein V1906_01160 [Candidatus Woesearchaeota archaeon]